MLICKLGTPGPTYFKSCLFFMQTRPRVYQRSLLILELKQDSPTFLLLNEPRAPNPLVAIASITPGKQRQSSEQQGGGEDGGWSGGRVPPPSQG